MRLILRLLANMAALALATWLLSGITLTAPTTERRVLTLGLFLIVINALMLLLTSWISDQVHLGWSVTGFWTAVFGSIIVSIVSFVVNALIPEKDEHRRRRVRA